MNSKSLVRRLCVDPLRAIIGRRNFYRLALFLVREARHDVPNNSATNGEQAAQATLISSVMFKNSPLVVFDVGANRGEWTMALLREAQQKSRKLQVHAFEPCRETFDNLTKCLERADITAVIAVNKGCSSASGTASMTVYGPDCEINTICEPIGDNPKESSKQEIQLTTVDEYCLANRIARIDFLKIDAEGHDCEIITGATRMLRDNAIIMLQFEYNWRWIGARHYLRDAFNLLKPLNYFIGKLTLEGVEFYPEWKWQMETFWEGNYIACLPEVARSFKQLRPDWLFE
jgi:FkbM family methyltransferase